MNDVILTSNKSFVSIMFQTELAKNVLINDDTLNKLFYYNNNVPTIDFPREAKDLIKTYLLHKELTYIEN